MAFEYNGSYSYVDQVGIDVTFPHSYPLDFMRLWFHKRFLFFPYLFLSQLISSTAIAKMIQRTTKSTIRPV